MARLMGWQYDCEKCGKELDIHENEYKEVEDQIWCKECFDIHHNENNDKEDDNSSVGVTYTSVSKTSQIQPSGGNSQSLPNIDTSNWGIDADKTQDMAEAVSDNFEQKYEEEKQEKNGRLKENIENHNICMPSTVSEDKYTEVKWLNDGREMPKDNLIDLGAMYTPEIDWRRCTIDVWKDRDE